MTAVSCDYKITYYFTCHVPHLMDIVPCSYMVQHENVRIADTSGDKTGAVNLCYAKLVPKTVEERQNKIVGFLSRFTFVHFGLC